MLAGAFSAGTSREEVVLEPRKLQHQHRYAPEKTSTLNLSARIKDAGVQLSRKIPEARVNRLSAVGFVSAIVS
jgi:hypothetical protein